LIPAKDRFYIEFYLDLFGVLVALIFFISMHFVVKSFKLTKLLCSIYSIFSSLIFANYSVIYHFLIPNEHSEYEIRNRYIMIILSMIEYLFILEYNFILGLILLIVNVTTCVLIFILYFSVSAYGYREIFISFFIIMLVIYVKKFNSVLQRQNY
jgi:hypothetical protein